MYYRLMGEISAEQLESVLEAQDDLLAALPGVVGWGVGLDAQGRPIIQVFVSVSATDGLVAELGQMFDRLEVLVQSRPAEGDQR